jgi:two-component sensor histidine kinase
MHAVLNRIHGWPLWLRLCVAAALLGAAHAVQIPLDREVPGEPFLLFFLIVVACTVAFGRITGFIMAGASGVLSVFFFEPGHSLHVKDAADLVQIELYAVLAILTVIGLDRLGRALEAVYAANRVLAESERQKDVLLNELAHRVANNFATVAALIQQKSATVADPQAKSALDEATEQVRVMARIHSQLKAGDDRVVLDSRRLMLDLCADLRASLVPADGPVSITCEAASLPLSAREAVPIGLMVNELVTNSVKYAFPGGRKGVVRVLLERKAGVLRLAVEDNGVGMQGPVQGTGLGHRLLRALADQLAGRLEVNSSGRGTMASIHFTPSTPRTADARPQGVSVH